MSRRTTRCTPLLALLVWRCSNSSTSEHGTDASTRMSSGATRAGTTGGGPEAGTGGAAGQSSGGSGGMSDGAATGGAPPEGGAKPDAAGTEPPPPKLGACDSLGAEGVFEEITPPEVKAGIGTMTSDNETKGGTFAIAVDPVNQGTVYAGTLFQKVWKSTDCGATWVDIATGENGTDVDRGMNWTLAIDPVAPNVVYTNSGYGSNGLFKSVDGGIDWVDIWSAKSQPELGKAFTYNFANVVAIDPSNHQHILLTFHEACLAPHPATCIAETMDAGSTWRLLDGNPTWSGNEGQVIFFLNDSQTWLWGSQSNGFWRSGDRGQSWEAITGMTTSHLQGSEIARAHDGTFFAAASDGIWRSPDGTASTWSLVPNTGPIVGGLVTDGATLFASNCYFTDFCNPRYMRSPETDGQNWTTLTSPTLSQGGTMGFDEGHHLLYSSNLDAGLWRVVVH